MPEVSMLITSFAAKDMGIRKAVLTREGFGYDWYNKMWSRRIPIDTCKTAYIKQLIADLKGA